MHVYKEVNEREECECKNCRFHINYWKAKYRQADVERRMLLDEIDGKRPNCTPEQDLKLLLCIK